MLQNSNIFCIYVILCIVSKQQVTANKWYHHCREVTDLYIYIAFYNLWWSQLFKVGINRKLSFPHNHSFPLSSWNSLSKSLNSFVQIQKVLVTLAAKTLSSTTWNLNLTSIPSSPLLVRARLVARGVWGGRRACAPPCTPLPSSLITVTLWCRGLEQGLGRREASHYWTGSLHPLLSGGCCLSDVLYWPSVPSRWQHLNAAFRGSQGVSQGSVGSSRATQSTYHFP